MRSLALLAAVLLVMGCDRPRFPVSEAEHAVAIEAWQKQRTAGLKAENGWLSLVGLYWLEPGDNDFGSGGENDFVLEHAALADHAGTFAYANGSVIFRAAPDAKVMLNNAPVTQIEMTDDHAGEPTMLAAGSLRFHVIERAGNHGIRVRDLDNPARTAFEGLDYFPARLDWRKEARFEPWPQPHAVKIINILGMVDAMASPGELVFEHDGAEYRLTVLAEPGDEEWFVMIADATSGRETYGAGRYLYISPPIDGVAVLDFNKAYNPPCAFTALATCPLPPASNRLALAVTAGEKKYHGGGWQPGD